MKKKNNIAESISQKQMLLITGIIGFAFPIILIIGSAIASECDVILPAISTYYHSVMGDVFVSLASMLAFCLFVYRGYDGLDKVLTSTASLALLGVAFFPTWISNPSEINCQLLTNSRTVLIGNIHYACAGLFFLLLAYICLFEFTKGNKPYTKNKIKRNRIYKISGILIISSIVAILVYSKLSSNKTPVKDSTFIFWTEVVVLWAFSLSWLIKGELILQDEES